MICEDPVDILVYEQFLASLVGSIFAFLDLESRLFEFNTMASNSESCDVSIWNSINAAEQCLYKFHELHCICSNKRMKRYIALQPSDVEVLQEITKSRNARAHVSNDLNNYGKKNNRHFIRGYLTFQRPFEGTVFDPNSTSIAFLSIGRVEDKKLSIPQYASSAISFLIDNISYHYKTSVNLSNAFGIAIALYELVIRQLLQKTEAKRKPLNLNMAPSVPSFYFLAKGGDFQPPLTLDNEYLAFVNSVSASWIVPDKDWGSTPDV